MSEKSNKILGLMDLVSVAWEPPAVPPDTSLLELGLLCVLTRRLTGPQAEKTLRALRVAFPEWNELRVSQAQEFQAQVQTARADVQRQVAGDVKEYLQEVYQKRHGFDLEFMREDPAEAARFASQLDFLGSSAAHYLLLVASGGEVPVSNGIVRVLDRLGLMRRTSSIKKAQAALAPLVPAERRADFAVRYGRVVDAWCDAKRPICWECALVVGCPFGKKVEREWRAQQRRLEVQRRKDEERRQREEERERKRAEAEARRRARDEAKRRAADERKRAREAVRKAKEEARQRAAQKRAVEKAARAKRAAKRAAAARPKKSAAKAPSKSTARKPATKATRRPPTKKKPARPAKKKTTKRRR